MVQKLRAHLVILFLLITLSACAPSDEALQSIPVSAAPPPVGCQYLHRISVDQPHGMQSGWMPSVDQQNGLMKAIRRKADEAGANYVQLLAQHAVLSADGGQADQVSSIAGILYKCK